MDERLRERQREANLARLAYELARSGEEEAVSTVYKEHLAKTTGEVDSGLKNDPLFRRFLVTTSERHLRAAEELFKNSEPLPEQEFERLQKYAHLLLIASVFHRLENFEAAEALRSYTFSNVGFIPNDLPYNAPQTKKMFGYLQNKTPLDEIAEGLREKREGVRSSYNNYIKLTKGRITEALEEHRMGGLEAALSLLNSGFNRLDRTTRTIFYLALFSEEPAVAEQFDVYDRDNPDARNLNYFTNDLDYCAIFVSKGHMQTAEGYLDLSPNDNHKALIHFTLGESISEYLL